MTTEAEARVAAESLAEEHGLIIPDRLVDGDREQLSNRVWLYNAPEGFPAGWWVGIAVDATRGLLKSSTVIGVCKATGEAERLGSANDEG